MATRWQVQLAMDTREFYRDKETAMDALTVIGHEAPIIVGSAYGFTDLVWWRDTEEGADALARVLRFVFVRQIVTVTRFSEETS